MSEETVQPSGEFWVWLKDHLVRASKPEVDSIVGSQPAVTWVTERQRFAAANSPRRVRVTEPESVRS